MMGRRTRRRRVLVHAVVLVVGVCCLALATGTEARGAAPSQVRFTYTDSFTDTTSCSVPIEVDLAVSGLVVRDAGFLFFNPDGGVAFMHGPHPLLVGDTASLCAAFS